MKKLPINVINEDILNAVEEWVSLLSEERYEDAFDFFLWRAHNSDWTPALLEHTVRTADEYSLDDSHHKVTPFATAQGVPRMPLDLWRADDGLEGQVVFTLPLDGKWSNMVVTIDFCEIDGELIFELGDMRIPW